ncbi:hypothetical protein IHN63_00250 [Deinococcus sp. 6YEL10]|uniref:DNA polymerase n=1 Tax=Deinococcus sp. 6YEL10 TaxID=2745870 RepID=UPI001E374441|nr:DNA polymerase [Deinococcus sp. 6YEL10]MCD0159729.1 hypothetical protein [Deinococcus sp. 6YEL10]
MEIPDPLKIGSRVLILQGAAAAGKKLTELGHRAAPENIPGTIHAITSEAVKIKTNKWNILSLPRLDINTTLSSLDVATHLHGHPIAQQFGLPPVPFDPARALLRDPLIGDLALHIPDHRIVQVLQTSTPKTTNEEQKLASLVQFPGESNPRWVKNAMLNAFYETPDIAPDLGFSTFEEVVGTNPLGYLNRPKCYLISTSDEFDMMMDSLYFAPEIGIDTETRGLINDAFVEGEDYVIGICLAGEPNVGYYVPIGHIDPERVRQLCPHLWDEATDKPIRPPRTSTEGWATVRACMYPDQLDRHDVIRALRPLLTSRRAVMHNATFDLNALLTLGIEITNYCDTLIASRLENDNRVSHSLKALVGPGYFSEVEQKIKHSVVRRKVRIKYSEASDEDKTLTYVRPFQCSDYAAADSADTFALNLELEPRIRRIPTLWAYYQETELPFIRRVVVNHIIRGGVEVKHEPIRALHQQLTENMHQRRAAIDEAVTEFVANKRQHHQGELAGTKDALKAHLTATFHPHEPEELYQEALTLIDQTVNLDALSKLLAAKPTHLKRLITSLKRAVTKPDDNYQWAIKKNDLIDLVHTHWKLPVAATTKGYAKAVEQHGRDAVDKKQYSAITKNTLPHLRASTREGSVERTFFDELGKYRQVSKLIEAFTDPLLNQLSKMAEPIIHPDFNSLGAKSGRSSCRLPNLQQLPSRGAWDVRVAFTAGDGYLFADCDYEAQELRVMAAFSRDPKMLELIEQGADLHCYTVRAVWPELAHLTDEQIKTEHKPKRDAAKAVMFG